MYRCEKCGGTFAHFKTLGQCPLCGVWASVKCSGCGHIAQAKEFIDNGDKCTKCGAKVPMPGGSTECFIANRSLRISLL